MSLAAAPPKATVLERFTDSGQKGVQLLSSLLPKVSPRPSPLPSGPARMRPPNPSTYSSPWHSMGKKGGVGGQPRVQKTGEHLESLVRGAGGCGPFPHPRGPSLRPDSLSACLPSSLLDICLPLDVAAPPGWRCEGSGLPAKE